VSGEKDDSQAAREERARRLREEIANVESGNVKPKPPDHPKSIREQVDEASREQDESGST